MILLSFPSRLDCILSQLRLIRSSKPTNTRSVSDALPCPIIAELGSKHADCPILPTITVPELNLCHITLSELCLVWKAVRGSPNNKVFCRISKNSHIFKIPLAISIFRECLTIFLQDESSHCLVG